MRRGESIKLMSKKIERQLLLGQNPRRRITKDTNLEIRHGHVKRFFAQTNSVSTSLRARFWRLDFLNLRYSLYESAYPNSKTSSFVPNYGTAIGADSSMWREHRTITMTLEITSAEAPMTRQGSFYVLESTRDNISPSDLMLNTSTRLFDVGKGISHFMRPNMLNNELFKPHDGPATESTPRYLYVYADGLSSTHAMRGVLTINYEYIPKVVYAHLSPPQLAATKDLHKIPSNKVEKSNDQPKQKLLIDTVPSQPKTKKNKGIRYTRAPGRGLRTGIAEDFVNLFNNVASTAGESLGANIGPILPNGFKRQRRRRVRMRRSGANLPRGWNRMTKGQKKRWLRNMMQQVGGVLEGHHMSWFDGKKETGIPKVNWISYDGTTFTSLNLSPIIDVDLIKYVSDGTNLLEGTEKNEYLLETVPPANLVTKGVEEAKRIDLDQERPDGSSGEGNGTDS